MGWALLGAGLLLALYTLLRHGLRRVPPPLSRPELRGRTAIVTGERRERPPGTAPGYGPAPRSQLRSPFRSVPQGEAAASGRPRRWSWPAAGPGWCWQPAAPRGGRPPPAASAR